MKEFLKDALKRIALGGDQDSKAYSFNLKDVWHTVKLGFWGAVAVGAPVLLHQIDAYNFGPVVDGMVSTGILAAAAAIQSFIDDRRKKIEAEDGTVAE